MINGIQDIVYLGCRVEGVHAVFMHFKESLKSLWEIGLMVWKVERQLLTFPFVLVHAILNF